MSNLNGTTFFHTSCISQLYLQQVICEQTWRYDLYTLVYFKLITGKLHELKFTLYSHAQKHKGLILTRLYKLS